MTMSSNLLCAFITLLVNMMPKFSNSYLSDLSKIHTGISVKILQKTIFDISFIPYEQDVNELCITLLFPIEVISDCFQFNATVKSAVFPASVKGHINLIFDAFLNEQHHRHLAFTLSQRYFVTQTAEESSVNQRNLSTIPSVVHFIYPPYGSIQKNKLQLNFSADEYTQNRAATYSFNILGVTSFSLNAPINEINSHSVEPASWFLRIKPIFKTDTDIDPLHGYTEETYIGKYYSFTLK